MFFTQDDYKKIKLYLAQNAKMDTDFSELSENDIVIKDDIVAIVHNGQNYKIPISTLSKVILSDTLSSIVKDVQYNPDTKKITKNIGDETIDVVSASQIVADGKGVKSVNITSGSLNGTIKLVVDGVGKNNIAVKGLKGSAYKDVADIISESEDLVSAGVVKRYVEGKIKDVTNNQLYIVCDDTPTLGSSNPVTSEGLYVAFLGKLDTGLKGAPNGLAELDSNGKVLQSLLPSYVSDIIEGYYDENADKFYRNKSGNIYSDEVTGSSGFIYIDVNTRKTYRWGGTTFAIVSEILAIGETSESAYRGDRGAAAYAHSLITSGNPHNVTARDIGLGNVDNTSDLNKPISSATLEALDIITNTIGKLNIPRNTSDLTNDSGFISEETDPTVPAWAKEDLKPSYTASEVGAIPSSLKGARNGVAELGPSGLVLSTLLPSYVDRIVEGYYNPDDGKFYEENTYVTEILGEQDIVYFSLDTAISYRFGGTVFAEIPLGVGLGETAKSAFRGDWGKVAYNHANLVTGNPHRVTAEDLNLGNVDNTSDEDKPISSAARSRFETIEKILQNISGLETDPTVPSWAKQPNKPTYTAEEVGAIPIELKGSNNGVAELNSIGMVPSSQLPSYVDEIIEGYYNENDGKFYSDSAYTIEIPGQGSKIYVSLDTTCSYRFGGTVFTLISSGVVLGELSTTAYRGDRGKIAYDHSQSQHARVDATKVEASTTNGYIKIDGVETKVYEHPPVSSVSEGEETIITKESIGLGNVTNDAQVKRSEMGVPNGVATLGEDGYIPNSQINPDLRRYRIQVITKNRYESLEEYEQDVLYFVYEGEEEGEEFTPWGFGDGFPITLSDNSTFPIILS